MKICDVSSRRGLSTVVTGAIMLSAVAVLGTMVVAWSNTNLFANQQSLEASFSAKYNKINEFIIIENIWFKQTAPKEINITINNAGNIGLNVTEIKIDNSTHVNSTKITNGGLAPGKSYNTEIRYEWKDSKPLDILITTERGSIFRTQELPP